MIGEIISALNEFSSESISQGNYLQDQWEAFFLGPQPLGDGQWG